MDNFENDLFTRITIKKTKTVLTFNQFNDEQIDHLKKVGLVDNKNRVDVFKLLSFSNYCISKGLI